MLACRTTRHFDNLLDSPWSSYFPETLLQASNVANETFKYRNETQFEEEEAEQGKTQESAALSTVVLPSERDAITDGAVASLLSRASLGQLSLRASLGSIVGTNGVQKHIGSNVQEQSSVQDSESNEKSISNKRKRDLQATGAKVEKGKAAASSVEQRNASTTPLDDQYMVFELSQISLQLDFVDSVSSQCSLDCDKSLHHQGRNEATVPSPLPWISPDGKQRNERIWCRYCRAALGVVLRRPGLPMAYLCEASMYMPTLPPKAAILVFCALVDHRIVYLRTKKMEKHAPSENPNNRTEESALVKPLDYFSDDFPDASRGPNFVSKRHCESSLLSSATLISSTDTTAKYLPSNLMPVDLKIDEAALNVPAQVNERDMYIFPAPDALSRFAAASLNV